MEMNYTKVYSMPYNNNYLKSIMCGFRNHSSAHPLYKKAGFSPQDVKLSTYFVCNLYYQHDFVGFEISWYWHLWPLTYLWCKKKEKEPRFVLKPWFVQYNLNQMWCTPRDDSLCRWSCMVVSFLASSSDWVQTCFSFLQAQERITAFSHCAFLFFVFFSPNVSYSSVEHFLPDFLLISLLTLAESNFSFFPPHPVLSNVVALPQEVWLWNCGNVDKDVGLPMAVVSSSKHILKDRKGNWSCRKNNSSRFLLVSI